MNVDDARSRSDERFTTLFRHEYPAILRVAYLMIGDRAAAEDLAQEAFARLYARWWRVSRYERPGAWVRRVTIRLASRARAVRDRESGAMPDVASGETRRGFSEELRRALVALPAQQRAAIVLHYLEDLAVDEVATILACSTATAKVHLHRGRRRLEDLLKEERHVG